MDTNDVPRCLHCPAGTFAGDAGNTALLFRAQIPNYSDFASGVGVN